MPNDERCRKELEFYFEEAESLSGTKSNWGDMVDKIAYGPGHNSTDATGSYEHNFDDHHLRAIGKLRKVRAKIGACSTLTQHTLGQYFSCPEKIIGEAGFLDRYENLHDDKFSKLAKDYAQNKDLIGLLKLAQSEKTPPARLLRLALREYSDVSVLKRAG